MCITVLICVNICPLFLEYCFISSEQKTMQLVLFLLQYYTQNIACQCYQSCVSRPTRKTDSLNKSNIMQEHASHLSERFVHFLAAESKCLSQHANSSSCVVLFSENETLWSLFIFLKLEQHHLTKQLPLWMVIPHGTASRGNANKRRADSEAGVFNIQHV